MPMQFQDRGVRFQYPDNWKLEREESDRGWTVAVYSPETAFFLLTVDEGQPEIEEMAQVALDALRSEYPDLEADAQEEIIAGQRAVGHDVRFFSFDFTNTCKTRAFYGARGTILILWQVNDLEWESYGPALEAMCASLELTNP